MPTLPAVETVPAFLADWLVRRAREPVVGGKAVGLVAPLSALLAQPAVGPDVCRRFLDALNVRLATVSALAGPPRVPTTDPWLRQARRLAAVWSPDSPDGWWPALLALTDEPNGLVCAVLSGCIDDAVGPARGAERVAPLLAQLRGHDEEPFAHLDVPPAPGVAWRRVPVSDAPPAVAAEHEPEPAPVPGPAPDGLAAVAAALRGEDDPTAQALGRRLEGALDPAVAGADRARLVLGCLIALDELAAGGGRSWSWPRAAGARLLAAVRALPGCEVLDADLVGRPVRQVDDRAITVGTDDEAPPGEANRVTRVVRPGYALRRPDGSTQVLVKARVLIAP